MKNTKIVPRTHVYYPLISITENGSNKDYVISIDNKVSSPDYYVYAVHVLLTAKENDTVTILINTPGGHVDSGFGMINAMKRCKAHVTTNIVGYAYSCGAYIWAFGDTRLMGQFARGMFHTSSHGQMGRTRDIKEMAVAIEERLMTLLDEVVDKGILTADQRDLCLENKRDFYFTSKDLVTPGGAE
jgi:ATP-dependent protease ClpP protease subunit